MKIRTDFVTNSSSSSFVNIHIEGEKLMEILKKYKDILRRSLELREGSDDVVAFDFLDDDAWEGVGGAPSSKDELVNALIALIREDFSGANIGELCEELKKNDKEIVATLKTVRWEHSDEEEKELYTFKGKKESYKVRSFSEDDEDEYDD